ncbi:hypothetical protein [Actinomadura rudentiformis]|uniref:Uncharacterized protein n=1 Tax=Actinomadura rudentiformis TaxID=359158 RepID=A0A6H9YSN4_9ACTN|nr:hypothetical protein [Actinomadura rudentiformis]KAB2344909.1 hypothetical protein F8566_30430 [Actinomadura rudentiformis]
MTTLTEQVTRYALSQAFSAVPQQTAFRPTHISPADWNHGVLQGLRDRHLDWRVFPCPGGWIACRDGGYEITESDLYRLEQRIHAANIGIAAERERKERELLVRPYLDHSP